MSQKTAIIIGAGPAGLTAAYELLTRTDIRPVVLEASDTYVGGISKTVVYKGNRIDIGGHRFFSKSDRVMNWWLSFFPQEASGAERLTYQGKETAFAPGAHADPEETDRVMLVRSRKSRIYYRGTFFDYPITLSWHTIRGLGFWKMARIGFTYLFRKFFPRPETNLENFYINRFGDELYRTFFKSYTEKVWGVPCSSISAEWGAQRVKGLSISAVLLNALQKILNPRRSSKEVETSLIEWFLYPKLGPGAMWEEVAREVVARGGQVRMDERVVALAREGDRITSVTTRTAGGTESTYSGDYVFSTMPVRDLMRAIEGVKADAGEVSAKLEYRDFITVGLLLDKRGKVGELDDNWIYIHDDSVKVGRIQLFHNWSPYLVADPEQTAWIGLEYFCDEGDALWNESDEALIARATEEVERLGLASRSEVLDGTVLREPKTYPSYTGAYAKFDEVREYLDAITNLYPLGRNGMHRYNNQDHSMLTAMTAVDLIIEGDERKDALWRVNTEQEYHEEK